MKNSRDLAVLVSDNTPAERAQIAAEINKMFETTDARPVVAKVGLIGIANFV